MRKMTSQPVRATAAATILLSALLVGPAGVAAQAEPHVTAQDALQALATRVKAGEQDRAFNITSAMRDYCVAGVGTQNGAYSVNDLEKMVGQQEAGRLTNLAVGSNSTFIMSRARGCLDQNAGRVARGSNPAGPGSVSPAVTFEGTDPNTGKAVVVGPGQ